MSMRGEVVAHTSRNLGIAMDAADEMVRIPMESWQRGDAHRVATVIHERDGGIYRVASDGEGRLFPKHDF